MSTDFDRLILDEAPGGVVVTTRKGQVVHWTRGAELIFGYAAAEALGRPLAELIELEDGRGHRDEVIHELNDKGIYDYECLRRRKDGSPIYISASSKAIYDGQGEIEYILFGKKDITYSKALRDAQLADAKYRALLESTPDGIIMANASGRIVLANSQAERLFGYAAGELRGQPLEVLLPQRFQAGHVGHRSRYFGQPRARTMGAGLELYGLRKDQVEFPVEISLSPIETEEGTLVMSAIRDTSERRHVEHVLQEKTLELERANQAKDRFLASMSHELRTPLNAVLGFAQLLADDSLPVTPQQRREFTACILKAGQHLLSLINETLDLAKIESGTITLSLEPVDLGELIDELRAMIEPLGSGRHIRMVFPRHVRWRVVADRGRLRQALLNLLSNAIKYNRDQGAMVVDVTQGERARVRIAVQDTGTGLHPGQIAELFQPFNRLGQEGGAEEGSGIGLVVTKRLVELMGGEIGVNSSPGIGSVFWIELPMDETAPAGDPAPPAHPGPVAMTVNGAPGADCVLYVEDNPANVRLMAEILRLRSGLCMLSAPDGPSGIALARSRRPAVILMDLNLPGMSGGEARALLAGDALTADIPVIALTANAMPKDVQAGLGAGFFRYITKPVDVPQLLDALGAALELRHAAARA